MLRDWVHRLTIPVAALLVLKDVFTPARVLLKGLILAVIVATKVWFRVRNHSLRERAADMEPISPDWSV